VTQGRPSTKKGWLDWYEEDPESLWAYALHVALKATYFPDGLTAYEARLMDITIEWLRNEYQLHEEFDEKEQRLYWAVAALKQYANTLALEVVFSQNEGS
jgi:hypothetical protein